MSSADFLEPHNPQSSECRGTRAIPFLNPSFIIHMKRTTARLLISSLLLLPFAHGFMAANEIAASPQPNIIFILADDLGYGQLGVMGDPIIQTPNIDRLAKEGVLFTEAYAGGTVCSPSRVSFLTGQDARMMHSPANTVLLRAEDVTLPHVLSAAGYQTALFGKFGVGNTFGVNDPMRMGFTRWRGILHNIPAHRQYPITLFDDNTEVFVPENVGGRKGKDAQRIFTDGALEFLEQQNGSSPFFIFMSYTSPHAEMAAPEAFVAPYIGKYPETPYPGWTGDANAPGFPAYYPEPVQHPNAVTAGMITALDAYIGELLAKLAEKGLAENTIVFFTSDNGPHSEGGADPLAMNAARPFRGGKRDLYEGGIRVPMIVRWPAKVEAGRVDDTPWAFADLLPTLVHATGASTENVQGLSYNGQSILPVLLNPQADMPDRILYWAFGRQVGDPNSGIIGDVAQAARKGQWKAVKPGPDSAVELYKIAEDPRELNDLASAFPAVTKEFEDLFAQYWN
jgi:arylsulfatase A